MNNEAAIGDQWLTLGQVAEQLNVHPNTVRRWADRGDFPCMLTPGGHRRFAAAEVAHLSRQRQTVSRPRPIDQLWAEQAVAQARQEVSQHQDDRWLAGLDEATRQQTRRLSQQLMELARQYLAAERSDEVILAAAGQIGREYGQIGRAQKLPLVDLLQAVIFFRDTLLETAWHLPVGARFNPELNWQLARRVNTFLNVIHLAMAELYDDTDTDRLPGN